MRVEVQVTGNDITTICYIDEQAFVATIPLPFYPDSTPFFFHLDGSSQANVRELVLANSTAIDVQLFDVCRISMPIEPCLAHTLLSPLVPPVRARLGDRISASMCICLPWTMLWILVISPTSNPRLVFSKAPAQGTLSPPQSASQARLSSGQVTNAVPAATMV